MLRVPFTATVAIVRKDDGAVLLRSATPLEGYRATGKSKERFDRLLTGDAASYVIGILDALASGDAAVHDPAIGTATAWVADGYMDIPVAATGKRGAPAATGPTIADMLASAATPAATPPAKGKSH